MRKPISLSSNILLLFISLVWGLGFIPQRLGLETLEPMGFNVIRFALGALVLIPVLYFLKLKWKEFVSRNAIVKGGVLGFLLSLGAGAQQVSLGMTSIANVAFITGFYVVLVPVMGYALGHRYSKITWFGGFTAVVGLGFLSGFGGEYRFRGDMVALFGAVFWAVHLLAITEFVKKHNAYLLAFYQFVFCSIFSLLFNITTESHFFPSDYSGYLWAALNGVFVVGIAYTLQVAVLEKVDPFVASLVFSLESVFGAIAGYWVFSEVLGIPGIVGAALMLVGCVLAQVPEKSSSVTKHQ